MKAIFIALAILFSMNAFAADQQQPSQPKVKVPLKVQALYAVVVSTGLCFPSDDEDYQPQEYTVDATTKLYLLNCIAGAYNTNSLGYLYSDDGTTQWVTQVSILTLQQDEKGKNYLTPSFELINAYFDESAKTLGTMSLARSLADCGQSTLSQISSDAVKTLKIWDKQDCDGKGEPADWPLAWEQK